MAMHKKQAHELTASIYNSTALAKTSTKKFIIKFITYAYSYD